jgi:hypothetical protein
VGGETVSCGQENDAGERAYERAIGRAVRGNSGMSCNESASDSRQAG